MTSSSSIHPRSTRLNHEEPACVDSYIRACADIDACIHALNLPPTLSSYCKDIHRKAYELGYVEALGGKILIAGCLHLVYLLSDSENCPTLEDIAAIAEIGVEDAALGAVAVGEFLVAQVRNRHDEGRAWEGFVGLYFD